MTSEQHSHLLQAIETARQLTLMAGNALETADDHEYAAASITFEKSTCQLQKLISEYETKLPRIPLSRCPFSGEIFTLAIDTFDLDGPWWNAEAGARPVEASLPSLFTYTGAIQLEEDVPQTPFLCKPGPEVPFVVPRLLAEPDIKAVISTLKIKKYTAYCIAYFSEPTPFDLLRVNHWGLNYYTAEHPDLSGYQSKSFETEQEYDFDLKPWIKAGKLLWIDTDDANLILHSTLSRFPYADLPGRKYPVGLFNGKIWNSLIELPPQPPERSTTVPKKRA
jgi:hypothetical protein